MGRVWYDWGVGMLADKQFGVLGRHVSIGRVGISMRARGDVGTRRWASGHVGALVRAGASAH